MEDKKTYLLKGNRGGKTFFFNWDKFEESFTVVPKEKAYDYTKEEAEEIAKVMSDKYYTYLIELTDKNFITVDSVGIDSKKFNKRHFRKIDADASKKTVFKLSSSVLSNLNLKKLKLKKK